MPYRQFTTIASVKTAFHLSVIEGDRFLPKIEAIEPSSMLSSYLQEDYPSLTIYGSVSNGLQWQFLKLVKSTVTIDLNVYSLPPIDKLLGDLVWIAGESIRND